MKGGENAKNTMFQDKIEKFRKTVFYTGTVVVAKAARGFESHSLRHIL